MASTSRNKIDTNKKVSVISSGAGKFSDEDFVIKSIFQTFSIKLQVIDFNNFNL